MKQRQIHNLARAEVYALLRSAPDGLSNGEAARRLVELGPNALAQEPRLHWLRTFARQFTNLFSMLLNVAALLCFVAARLDGATSWQRFSRITVPMLRPTFFFVSVTGVVSAAQVFDTVYSLTGGGPAGRTDLVAHRIYAEAFGAAAIGRAAVMAIVLFVILVAATIAQHVYFRKRTSYELYG